MYASHVAEIHLYVPHGRPRAPYVLADMHFNTPRTRLIATDLGHLTTSCSMASRKPTELATYHWLEALLYFRG